jgi:Xaa-Pro aminopeptidase
MKWIFAFLVALPLFAQSVASSEYQARRDELARVIGPDGVFLALAPEPVTRNGSVDFPYRQNDDLRYLTGIEEPQTALVILPSEPAWRDMIFTPPFDEAAELWTGPIPTAEQVTQRSGIAKVHPYDQFDAFLAALFGGKAWGPSTDYRAFRVPGFPNFRTIQREGRATGWLLLGDRATTAEPVRELLSRLRTNYPELQFRDASPQLLRMREVKSASELALLQRAIDITDDAHRAAMQRVRTATHEYQLQATIEFTYRDRGADGWGFPSIVAAGRNATILHYVINEAAIVRDGLVLVDIGAEVDGYTADITRTYPADGTFSPEQRAIYEAVLRAQTESVKEMRPGATFNSINQRVEHLLGEDLLKLDLITKNEFEQVRMYYRHGVGHPIGLQVHDVYDRLRPFEKGMIVTNEPGIYVRRADVVASAPYKKMTEEERKRVDAALDKYADIGVRIEDDLLITEGAPRMLSKAPRTVAEVEAWMRK